MLQQFGESNNGPFSGEQPRRGRHSLEVALGEIVSTDPGISPGLLYTTKEVIKRVEGDQPSDQEQQDAAFLLRWFRERAAQESTPQAPLPKPVPDPEALRRSIESANNTTYSMLATTLRLIFTGRL